MQKINEGEFNRLKPNPDKSDLMHKTAQPSKRGGQAQFIVQCTRREQKITDARNTFAMRQDLTIVFLNTSLTDTHNN